MTRKVALIGKPLRRTHSPVMHNAAFARFGIEAGYELREISPDRLDEFVDEARGAEWIGFQVTAPYKQAIVPFLDRVEASAGQIDAVNSVAREDDGRLVGFNTDAPGFISAVRGAGIEITGARAVVAGAGGAARAVCWGLLTEGAAEVVIANRTFARAAALAESLSSFGQVTAVPLEDAALGTVLARCQLAVNATTVGMSSGGVVFNVAYLGDEAAVFDLVYVPPVTPLVAAAHQRGLRVRNGLDMLVNQAAIAFERWTGVAGAGTVMREALEASLPSLVVGDERG